MTTEEAVSATTSKTAQVSSKAAKKVAENPGKTAIAALLAGDIADVPYVGDIVPFALITFDLATTHLSNFATELRIAMDGLIG